jgi:SAM-dependent methyltransferase
MNDAAHRWADDLAAWAIPKEILAAAPESPWGLPVDLFRPSEPDVQSVSRIRALEALGDGGTVLDVGCGAGAASFALAPIATRVVGVDEDERMLAAFAEESIVDHDQVVGRWPDVAANVEPADVVVCHHVLYNVPDVAPFVEALTTHARRRVVVEVFDEHPLAWMNPLWRELHALDRPDRPHAADALAVIRELEPGAVMERWDGPARACGSIDAPMFAFLRRRLCLTPDRDDELRVALARTPPPAVRRRATIWWDR